MENRIWGVGTCIKSISRRPDPPGKVRATLQVAEAGPYVGPARAPLDRRLVGGEARFEGGAEVVSEVSTVKTAEAGGKLQRPHEFRPVSPGDFANPHE